VHMIFDDSINVWMATVQGQETEAHALVSKEMSVGLNPYPTKILHYDTTVVSGIVVKLVIQQ